MKGCDLFSSKILFDMARTAVVTMDMEGLGSIKNNKIDIEVMEYSNYELIYSCY